MAIETLEQKVTLEPKIEAPHLAFRLAGIGVARAETVELTNGVVGLVLAGKQATLHRAGARTVISTGSVDLTQGGAAMIVSAGDAAISRGGAGAMVVLGDAQMTKSVGGIVAAKSASVGGGGLVALAITPRLHVEQGGRVLAGPREIAALAIVGAALTSLVLLLARLRTPSQPE